MTKDNITLVIAILGFLLSFYTIVERYIQNRKHLEIHISYVFRIGNEPKATEILNIQIINKSREAITVSRMQVICENRVDGFGNFRKKLLTITNRSGNEITERNNWTSDILPIKIEGLGFFSGLLVSDKNNFVLTPKKKCKLILYTNKGKIISDYLFSEFDSNKLISECKSPD